MPKLHRKRVSGALRRKRFSPEPAAEAQREVAKPYHDDWWKAHIEGWHRRQIEPRMTVE